MKKSRRKQSGPRDAVYAQPSAVSGSSSVTGATAGVNLETAEHVYIAETMHFNAPWKSAADTQPSSRTVCGDDDYLIILIKEVLEQCKEKREALHTLEQNICQKIRATKKMRFSSFKELLGGSFRAFIEKNADHFAFEFDGTDYIVSLKKKQKKKKKSKAELRESEHTHAVASVNDLPVNTFVSDQPWHTDDEEGSERTEDLSYQWETVRRGKGKSKDNVPKLTRRYHAENTVSEKNLLPVTRQSTEELLIQNLIRKPPSNTLMFRLNDELYKCDRSQFIKDVTSLWNTPDRDNAYIIIGVQVCSKPPHTLEGLASSTDETVYQSMYPQNLLNYIPLFRYREIMCAALRIGVVEIERNHSFGLPSIISTDEMTASGLKKNQLLSRKNGRNIQVCPGVGQHHKIYEWFKKEKDPKASQEVSSPRTTPNQSYAQSVKGSQSESALESSSVTHGRSYAETASLATPSNAKQLLKALNNFQKVHFVLVSGSMQIASSNIEALAGAPWIAVYDFNVEGRDTGLLGILEDGIMRRRSLSVLTWCDNCKGITEKGTQWWSLRGRREIAESHTPESVQDWFRQVKDKLEKLSLELARFAEDYTVLSVLVLWPDSELEARCMHKFMSKLHEHVQSKIILCFVDSTKDFSQSKAATLVRLEFEESVEEFHVNLKEFCAEIELLTQSTAPPEKFQYQLPSAESKVVTLNEMDAAWLAQDLDVLYLQSPHTKELTDQDLKDQADIFFRGGTINWFTLYDKKYDHFDVKRVDSKAVVQYIQEFIDDSRNGVVTVYHAPGAGGTTMSRRVLWDLHKTAPCVHVRQRSGSSTEEIAARLVFLYDKCRIPVVALMDGEDENRIRQLSKQLRRHNVVILYVKRYPYAIDTVKASKGKFYLPGIVQRKESRKLVTRYMDRCEGDQTKIDALLKLDKDVQEEKEKHHMYEYGMTVYHQEFQGVRAYVRGHLQLEGNQQKDLQDWQKCLGFLALVYYYGQSSLPCQFFVSLLGKLPNYKVDLDDFPYQVKVFVVQDSREGKDQCIRVGHYIIAKEILEQLLGRRRRYPSGRNDAIRDKLSSDARKNLKAFSIEFISQAIKKKIKTSLTSQTISHILAKTFIFRDNEEISDMGAQGFESQTRRKPQFSQIMFDLDSDPPYHGRLEILQKLCDAFPHDPNFRAHLGRFYTCCRPEAEEEAEKHFKEALRLCNENSPTKEGYEVDEKSKLTLMHIYHMYGMFFQVRISKITKMCPDLKEDGKKFEEALNLIVDNAYRACENFLNSRIVTPSGHEESYTYTNEIHVRLRTCDFVNSNFPGGLRQFLIQTAGDGSDTARAFVTESVTEIDDLIMECYDVQVDDVNLLQKYVIWYHTLFSSCTRQLQTLLRTDPLEKLRLTITATKLKFRRPEDIAWVDSPMPETEIVRLVNLLEDVFQTESEDGTRDRNREKSKLELDYKDWILAIRHVQLTQVYKLEKVLERVRQWHDLCHSPQSTYYVFVLLSLLGFGTSSCSGNTECLVEAQMMLELMQKLSKIVLKSRFPREWLGRHDSAGIKRLVTNSKVSHEDRRIKNASRAKLAVCRGTICTKFQKAAGFIDLDLGLNTTPIKVFFIPARAELVESRHAGARVQFHLAFTLDKGYEAYEVKLLDRYRCNNCPQKVEMTWDQDEVLCKGCNSVITKNEHSVESRTTQAGGDSDQ